MRAIASVGVSLLGERQRGRVDEMNRHSIATGIVGGRSATDAKLVVARLNKNKGVVSVVFDEKDFGITSRFKRELFGSQN